MRMVSIRLSDEELARVQRIKDQYEGVTLRALLLKAVELLEKRRKKGDPAAERSTKLQKDVDEAVRMLVEGD